VKVGRGVSDGVTPGGRVGLGVPVEASGLGPVQLARRTAMHRPRSRHLVFMEMFITRVERGVNVFLFIKIFLENGTVKNYINKILPIEIV
jgi:hypothetical protein